ncbi:UNVERIFIED_CONTAM: hypothetical protein GTU68_010092 [Idotea baltica]|nr:hypothetical protein [Idotea baltica]
MSSTDAIALEEKYGAHNYHPLPVVLNRGEGVFVWDLEEKKYYDFLSAYSAINQGHCHPKIVDALISQSKKLTLTSRAFHNNMLGKYEEYACKIFGFDKLLPMNTGAEAVETALKVCRKWAYEKKGIAENKAQIVVCENNFHGRTTTIISFSNDPVARENFGPFTEGFIKIEYNNLKALETALEDNSNIAGFLVEPIQGEAGVYVPSENYLTNVAMAALKVIEDEQLAQNALELGELFRNEMNTFISNSTIVKKVRGKGLLNAILINDTEESSTAWDICMALKENGLLAKPTHGNIIRFAPPLVMNKEQLLDCVSIITNTLVQFEK